MKYCTYRYRYTKMRKSDRVKHIQYCRLKDIKHTSSTSEAKLTLLARGYQQLTLLAGGCPHQLTSREADLPLGAEHTGISHCCNNNNNMFKLTPFCLLGLLGYLPGKKQLEHVAFLEPGPLVQEQAQDDPVAGPLLERCDLPVVQRS